MRDLMSAVRPLVFFLLTCFASAASNAAEFELIDASTTASRGDCDGEPCRTVELHWPEITAAPDESARASAESAIREFFFDKHHVGARADSAEGLAKAILAAAEPGRWAYQRKWEVYSRSPGVLSLRRVDQVENFASRPLLTWEYLNLAARTGERLGLEAWFAPESMAELNARAEKRFREEYGPEPGTPIAERWEFEGGTFRVSQDFGVDAEGLLFDWDQYEIGPGAAGAPGLRVSWEEVEDLLRPGAPRRMGITGDERAALREQCADEDERIVLLRSGERTRHQNAQEAVAALRDGDLLWFCPGRHVVREPLRVAGLSDLRIGGEKASVVSLVDAPVLTFDECDRLLVEGLHVVHEIGAWCSQNTMELSGCIDVLISGCDLDGSGYFGLGLSGCRRATIRGNVLRNCHAALADWGSSELIVRGNDFRDNEQHFLSPPPPEWLEANNLGAEGRRSPSSAVPPSAQPDCSAAESVVEFTVCANPALRTADERLERLFAAVSRSVPRKERKAWEDEHQAWRRAREGCADDQLCLARVYASRTAYLLDLLPESD